ncbi:MAG: penicillin-binding transpeptidase domain-containing protein [bacterium]
MLGTAIARVTAIDPRIQERTSELLERRLLELAGRGVGNGAVVVIENAGRSVLALVGSGDYGDVTTQGQVNGALAPRSPGSTLKPFAYALALDDRLITPSTLLEDVPASYAGYAPQNYDGSYRGYVTAGEALARSMNVPAVYLLHRLGMGRFYDFLRTAGISTLEEERTHYGLSLILGGAGFTLLELTNLYATLAEGGGFRPPRLLREAPAPRPRPVLSPGAAYIVTDMLTEVRRPDLPSAWEDAVHLPSMAWKTGTSYGHHDAWSVGYTPRYTVGVWLGNFDGTASRALVGADAAGPLLFDLASSLESDGGTVFTPPPGVEERLVCSLSGLPPGPGCPDVRAELYLPGVSPDRTCDLHVRFEVDDVTGSRLCPHCRAGRSRHLETRVVWPAGMAAWLKASGHPVPEFPEHLPSCATLASGSGPRIRSPVAGVTYILREGVPLEDQRIRLEASAPSSVRTLYWFVDGELVSRGPPERAAFLDPSEGHHRVVCMDDEGRTSRMEMTIQGPSQSP